MVGLGWWHRELLAWCCGMVGNWCLKTHTIQILGSHRACSQVGVTLVTLVTCSSSLSLSLSLYVLSCLCVVWWETGV